MTSPAPWDDPAQWERLRSPDGCPICRDGGPADVIAALEVTWVTAPPHAPLPGYACVVSRRHAVEPFELPEAERAAFWDDVMVVARALAGLFRPAKLNYEIHGNTIPHLHAHLYPRYAGDPYAGGPIDASRAAFLRTADELDAMRAALPVSSAT